MPRYRTEGQESYGYHGVVAQIKKLPQKLHVFQRVVTA